MRDRRQDADTEFALDVHSFARQAALNRQECGGDLGIPDWSVFAPA
jgi:hypothetical protein